MAPDESTSPRRIQEERDALERELFWVRRESDRRDAECRRLARELAVAREAQQDVSTQLAQMQETNAELVNLHIAGTRLHESVLQHDVLAAIQEIIINLIGSEELAVYEASPDGHELLLVNSFGIDPERYARVSVGTGAIGTLVATGRPWVATDAALADGLTACIPLLLGNRLIGAIVVFRMLPQKPVLASVDRQLFELLHAQAGAVLHFTRDMGIREEPACE